MKHAAKFTKTLGDITNYVQTKYNSNAARMIQDVERPLFTYTTLPVGCLVTLSHRMTTQEKVNEIDVYVWKKGFEKIHNKESV